MHNIPETLISLEDILHEQSEKSLQQYLDIIKVNHQQLDIESISAYGEPPFAIERIAGERQIDLVVLGSRGRGAIPEAIYGSTTSQVIKTIAQPLLIVPFSYIKKVPKKIVLATDLVQMEDLQVLEPMLRVARKFEAEIVIMNVTGNDEHHSVKHAIRRLNFNNHFEGIERRFDVVENKDIVSGISDFLDAEQADLLVLSPKQYPYFSRMFHRSITKSMVRRTEIPMLVV